MAYPQLTFSHTTFHPSSFIARKRSVIFKNTIPYQLSVLKKCGTFDAYKLEWRDQYRSDPEHWPIAGDYHYFWDSDLAKWIEGACYALQSATEEELEALVGIREAVEEVVETMRGAQMEDGYLNIHYQVVEIENRFTNLRDCHELYNAGHLIEAAIAHHKYFKNNLMLEPLLKYVDLLYSTFGPGDKIHGYPGHPEIELALLRLHSVTGNPKHLALARYFIEERGNPKGVDGRHFYAWEAEQRGEHPYKRPNSYPMIHSYWYQQAHLPIIEQESVEGHAVRAMYLLTGVADLQRKKANGENSESRDYVQPLKMLWDNMVDKKMYLTGGVGAMYNWEGFGIDYFLPQSKDEGGCYAETCAAIGVMMLAQRMLQLELDGRYGDVMELCFYNSVLGGMSCNGKKFAYENALASCENDPCKREEWFTCACCPPNVSRLLASIGGYMWDFEIEQKRVDIKVHMFGSATLKIPVGEQEATLKQTSEWPWKWSIDFNLDAPEDLETSISIRIPGWATEWKITPEIASPNITKGYLRLPTAWLSENPTFKLSIPMPPRFLSPHPFTHQDTITLARGPLIYCLEDIDNPWVTDHFKTLVFTPSKAILSEAPRTDESTGETYIVVIASLIEVLDGGVWTSRGSGIIAVKHECGTGPGVRVEHIEVLESDVGSELVFTPFYYRANRGGKGMMRTGLRRR
ncbi:hypothetical protein BLS_001368 [Venturia inaequalis]|uniref:Glycoside hydrolase family 127 protein n=1 Tax=Venturia inaequalis TaxID=5025 RepID=A0A8H3VBA8_VENIN|nr:hypothetical protein BLS_001368 [Venturia inaequalis]